MAPPVLPKKTPPAGSKRTRFRCCPGGFGNRNFENDIRRRKQDFTEKAAQKTSCGGKERQGPAEKTRRNDRLLSACVPEAGKKQAVKLRTVLQSGKAKSETESRFTAFSCKRGSLSVQGDSRRRQAQNPAFRILFPREKPSSGENAPARCKALFLCRKRPVLYHFPASRKTRRPRWKRSRHFPALAGSRLTMATAPETSRTMRYCSLPSGPVSRYRLP